MATSATHVAVIAEVEECLPDPVTDLHAVQTASRADAPVLGRLLADLRAEFDDETDSAQVLAERFARILQDPDVFALVSGGDTGFALVTLRPAIWFDGPVAQLEELYVVPARRGDGIGLLCYVGPTG